MDSMGWRLPLERGTWLVVALLGTCGPLLAGPGAWTPAGPSLAAILSLAVPPDGSGSVYAGTVDGQAFKSTDGGATWTAANAGLPASAPGGGAFTVLRWSPVGDYTLYAGTAAGLLVSQDHAASWAPLSAACRPAAALAIAPSHPETLYCTDGKQVFRSTDGGSTFQGMATSAAPIQALSIDRADENTLYATTSQQLYKSTDGGATLQALASPSRPTDPSGPVVVDPQQTSVVYVLSLARGVLRSFDGGVNWFAAGPNLTFSGPGLPTAFAVDPTTDTTLFLGTSTSILKSTDDGASWVVVAAGVATVHEIVVDAASSSRVYAGTDGGLLRSQDGGTTWTAMTRGLTAHSIGAVATDPTTAGSLYAVRVVTPASSSPLSSISRSLDRGATWSAAGTGIDPALNIFALAADPSIAGTAYAATDKGLWKSADGGASWRAVFGGQSTSAATPAVAIDPHQGNVVYLVVTQAQPIDEALQSENGGATWNDFTSTFPFHTLGNSFTSIAVDPQDSPTVYLAGTQTSWKTTDGGRTWTQMGTPKQISHLLVDPGTTRTLYALAPMKVASATVQEVVRSKDGGLTWFVASHGLESAGGVVDLVGDPRHSGVLYAATPQGLYLSLDGAGTWAPFAAGLGAAPTVLAVDASRSDILYAGTAQQSLWSYSRLGGFCVPGAGALCLTGDRFTAQVAWGPSVGVTQPAQARALTASAGIFWFFEPGNDELLVKAVDGRALNGSFWIFRGSLTDRGYTLDVEDTFTGATRSYVNPPGTLASGADVAAFPDPEPPGAPRAPAAALPAAAALPTPAASRTPAAPARFSASAAGACVPDAHALCLDGGRFQVAVTWQIGPASGAGQALPDTDASGTFWFFTRDDLELLVKILDGTSINGHFWVFYGGATDLAFTLTITDTSTGAQHTYLNPAGQLASAADLNAF